MVINSVEHLGGYCILLCLYKFDCVDWFMTIALLFLF